MLSLSAAASASWLPFAQNCSCMMVSCYCRRYYWFEVLDECNNLMLDTDGVGNALASILEDSKLQVWGCIIHFCFSVSVTRSVAGAERRRRCSQRCWYTSPPTNSKNSHIDVELLVPHMNWKEFSLLVRATAGPSAGKGCVLFLHPMRKCGFTVECCGR
jgi:hypothetical protein